MAQRQTSAKGVDGAWKDMSSEGGRARAARYSGEVLSEWASRGGKAVLARYGPDYFVQLRKRRKNYPKYSESSIVGSARSASIQSGRPNAAPVSGGKGRDRNGIENDHADQASTPLLTRRVITARQNGSHGGKQSALNLDRQERERRARAGGNALLNLYGKEYYSCLGKLSRKTLRPPKKSVFDEPPKISVAARRIAAMAAAYRLLAPQSQQGKNRAAMNTK